METLNFKRGTKIPKAKDSRTDWLRLPKTLGSSTYGEIYPTKATGKREARERHAKPAQTPELPNLERAARLLEDLPSLRQHPGVTHEQREALVLEVFRSITIDGKDFVSVEPNPHTSRYLLPW